MAVGQQEQSIFQDDSSSLAQHAYLTALALLAAARRLAEEPEPQPSIDYVPVTAGWQSAMDTLRQPFDCSRRSSIALLFGLW